MRGLGEQSSGVSEGYENERVSNKTECRGVDRKIYVLVRSREEEGAREGQ